MNPATQMAMAILRAKPDLDPALQNLLTPAVAWTLAVLLVSWQPAGAPLIDVQRYHDVTQQLDRYAPTLLRFRDAATQAQNDVDLAGASGLFTSAVQQIGATLLGYVLRSDRFRGISQEVLSQVPLPADLKPDGTGPALSESRARRFLGFDYRPRGQDAPAVVLATPQEVAAWQAQLKRTDLAPEMRWLLEQKLLAAKQLGYASAEEARQQWQNAMAQTSNPDLRNYFAQNLRNLGNA